MKSSTLKQHEPSLAREQVFEMLRNRISKEASYSPAIEDLVYCSWPETFGSTCGPFRGAGGQAMTTFRMEAWECDGFAVVFCGGRIVKTGHFSIGANYDK